MFPLGSEGGFHFRMIWDEELETDIGSNGTDGTARVGKEREVTSIALQELDRTREKHRQVSISMGINTLLPKSTDTQQSCRRRHQHAHKLLHMAHEPDSKSARWYHLPCREAGICLGIPSYHSRAAMAVESFMDMGLS